MRYLGIDASTKSTGISIYDNNELIAVDTLTASSSDVIKRIQKIINQLDLTIETHKPDFIILEEVRPTENEYGVGNLHTQKVLMWLQAAINFLCHEKYPNIKIDYIYPNEWRSWIGISTGRGVRRESLKAKDIEWVKEKYGLNVNDDEADAIGIVCGYIAKQKEDNTTTASKKKKGAW